MRERFELLLKDFSSFAKRDDESLAPRSTRIRTLLNQFVEVRKRSDAKGQVQVLNEHERMSVLLSNYIVTIKRYQEQQEQVADDFNLLDVMQVSGKEIRHSMMLAWLLDRDI